MNRGIKAVLLFLLVFVMLSGCSTQSKTEYSVENIRADTVTDLALMASVLKKDTKETVVKTYPSLFNELKSVVSKDCSIDCSFIVTQDDVTMGFTYTYRVEKQDSDINVYIENIVCTQYDSNDKYDIKSYLNEVLNRTMLWGIRKTDTVYRLYDGTMVVGTGIYCDTGSLQTAMLKRFTNGAEVIEFESKDGVCSRAAYKFLGALCNTFSGELPFECDYIGIYMLDKEQEQSLTHQYFKNSIYTFEIEKVEQLYRIRSDRRDKVYTAEMLINNI